MCKNLSKISQHIIQSFKHLVTFLMTLVSRYGKRIAVGKSRLKISALLILLGSIYTLTSYKGDGLTIGGDALVPFHPLDYLERLPSSTNPWAGFGSALPPIFSLPPLPEILIFSVFNLLCLDIYIINKLYLFILATFSAFSMYYLGTTIFRKNRNKQLIGVIVAISYLYNPYVMADTYKSMTFGQLSLNQSGLILFLALTIMFFRTRKIRYAVFSGFVTFLMLSIPGLGAYQLGFIALIGYSCIALYSLCLSRRSLLRTLAGTLITGSLGFLINSYWLIPFIRNLGLYVSFTSNFQTTTAFNNASILLNTLRLLNFWGFSAFAPYSGVYFNNPLIIALSFSWPFFAFAPLLLKEVRKAPKMLALYVILLVTIILACGSNPPLGSLYMNIANARLGNFYFLRPFYTTGAISQHVLTLEYSILIGLSSSLVYSRLKLRFRRSLFPKIGAIIIPTTLIISTWPIITGEIMRNWYSPDQYGVRIPDSYWQINEYLKRTSDADRRVLLLPPTEIYIGTSWGYQGTSYFYNLMFDVPLISGNEVPYGITVNETLLDQVYSTYYVVPEFASAIDVDSLIGGILTWQNDQALLTEEFLQVDFNNTYQIDSWHQVQLEFASTGDWLDNTHLLVQLIGELSLDRLQFGFEDTKKRVEWWSAQEYVYQVDRETLIPTKVITPITRNDGTTTLLMPLTKPNLPDYSISNISSLWIQYFVADSSDSATMKISKMLVAEFSPNTHYYSSLLAHNNVRYLLVDLAIKDGAKNEPQLWLQMLRNSNCFKLVWQEETLYIFENTTL